MRSKGDKNMQKTIIFSCAMLAISVSFAQDTQTQQEMDRAKKLVAEAQAQVQGVEGKLELSIGNGGNTFAFVGGQMFNGNPVKGQPYSAEAVTETTQTLADGNRITNRSSTTIYRDSEGRERREESIGRLGPYRAQGEPAKVIFISDPVAKVSYTLRPDERTAERRPHSQEPLRTAIKVFASETIRDVKAGVDPASPSVKTEQLAPQAIEGVVAQGTRTTTVIPAGQIGNERDVTIVNERWFSVDLGEVVMSKRSDPRNGETVYKLTNVNRSEPQHSLFEVPADYTVNDSGAMKEKELRDQKQQVRKEEQ
jgi:hypothetical protein